MAAIALFCVFLKITESQDVLLVLNETTPLPEIWALGGGGFYKKEGIDQGYVLNLYGGFGDSVCTCDPWCTCGNIWKAVRYEFGEYREDLDDILSGNINWWLTDLWAQVSAADTGSGVCAACTTAIPHLQYESLYIAGFNPPINDNLVAYDFSTNDYDTTSTHLPEIQALTSLCMVNNGSHVFIMGGNDNDRSWNHLFGYSQTTHSFIIYAEANLNRSQHQCAYVGGNMNHIFVFGGYTGVSYTKSIEKYDLDSNTWTLLTEEIPSNRRWGICTTHPFNYWIMCIGGVRGFLNLPDPAFLFNPITSQIKTTNVNYTHHGFAHVMLWNIYNQSVIDDDTAYLFLFGGRRYDPNTACCRYEMFNNVYFIKLHRTDNWFDNVSMPTTSPIEPTAIPTAIPTAVPITLQPTTIQPTLSPVTVGPTTNNPTTLTPTIPTNSPTTSQPNPPTGPTEPPTSAQPTVIPTQSPTTIEPTLYPSNLPSTQLPSTKTPVQPYAVGVNITVEYTNKTNLTQTIYLIVATLDKLIVSKINSTCLRNKSVDVVYDESKTQLTVDVVYITCSDAKKKILEDYIEEDLIVDVKEEIDGDDVVIIDSGEVIETTNGPQITINNNDGLLNDNSGDSLALILMICGLILLFCLVIIIGVYFRYKSKPKHLSKKIIMSVSVSSIMNSNDNHDIKPKSLPNMMDGELQLSQIQHNNKSNTNTPSSMEQYHITPGAGVGVIEINNQEFVVNDDDNITVGNDDYQNQKLKGDEFVINDDGQVTAGVTTKTNTDGELYYNNINDGDMIIDGSDDSNNGNTKQIPPNEGKQNITGGEYITDDGYLDKAIDNSYIEDMNDDDNDDMVINGSDTDNDNDITKGNHVVVRTDDGYLDKAIENSDLEDDNDNDDNVVVNDIDGVGVNDNNNTGSDNVFTIQ